MTRATWTDVPLAWVDYQEARVEALARDNQRLRGEVDFLRKVIQDSNHAKEFHVFNDNADLPRLLVRTMPVPEMTQ